MEELDFKLMNLSLTGRLCYLFMCIERYLSICYPDRDWSLVAEKCWQWTNKYWNDGCDIYSVVVPEYILECHSYEESNLFFEGKISENEYSILKSLFSGLTTGSPEDEINQVLMLPIEFNKECECTNFDEADRPTFDILHEMQGILSLHDISFPDINNIHNMTIDQRSGWGYFTDSKYLSIILKPDETHS